MARAVVLMAILLAALSLWIAATPLLGRIFGEATATASTPQPEPSSPPAADLGPVLDFAPFGLAEGNATIEAVQVGGGDLSLLGVMLAQTPSLSRAIIAGGEGATTNYGIGDTVQTDVVLTGVFVDHVTLDFGGQEQSLSFPTGNAGLPPAPKPAEPLVIPASSETAIGQYRAELLQDAPGLLARLGVQATKAGYLVTDAAAPEVLQAGLLPGDLIGSVNGTTLGDVTKDLAALDQAAALGQANLTVLRDGTSLLMTFPLE